MGEGVLNIIKIVFTLLLFPIVYVCATRFHVHLLGYHGNLQEFMLNGVVGFLLIYFFIYQFYGFHEAGQKLTQRMFSFAAPFDRLVASCIPIYTVGILLFLCITKNFFHSNHYTHYFLFFAGFTLAMHVLLVAQELQNQGKGIFRPGYFFTISLAFIFSLMIVILLLDLVYGEFTLDKFIRMNYGLMLDLYRDVFRFITFG